MVIKTTKNLFVCAHLFLCVSVCMDGDVKKRITGWWWFEGVGVGYYSYRG